MARPPREEDTVKASISILWVMATLLAFWIVALLIDKVL